MKRCSTLTAWALLLALLAATQGIFVIELQARCTWSLAGRSFVFLFEDAMVSMRYAYQLAHGQGLVWNPGEYVQGFTNLGWTLLMALGQLVDKSHETAAWFVLFANFLLHGALTVLVFRLARPLGVALALIAAAVVSTHSALLFWGTQGMETTLAAFLVTAAFAPWLPIQGKRLGAGAEHAPWIAALAFVVRSDGILFFAIATFLAWRERWRPQGDPGRRRLLAGSALGLALVAGVLLFQKTYYGDFFPNTYRLKVSGGATNVWSGLDYLREFTVGQLWNAPLVVGTLLGLVLARKERQSAPLTLLVLAWFGYVVWIGGDAFFGSRFFVPIVPLLVLVSVAGVGQALAGARAGRGGLPMLGLAPRLSAWLVVGVLAVLMVPCARASWNLHFEYNKPIQSHLSSLLVGLAIEQSGLPKQEAIAVLAAGMTPYFAPSYRFHDMLGKCDRFIASGAAHPGAPGHRKWNLRHSLDVVKPQLVVTAGPYDLNRSDASYQAAVATDQLTPFVPALWVDPTFRTRYRDNRVFLFFRNVPVETGNWVFARDDVHVRRIDLAAPNYLPSP